MIMKVKKNKSRWAAEGRLGAPTVLVQMIAQAAHAMHFGAAGTAENLVLMFDPMTNHSCEAVFAPGRQGVDGALKTVERVLLAPHHDLKGSLILIAAVFAFLHTSPPTTN
jgi:hypothetical protein